MASATSPRRLGRAVTPFAEQRLLPRKHRETQLRIPVSVLQLSFVQHRLLDADLLIQLGQFIVTLDQLGAEKQRHVALVQRTCRTGKTAHYLYRHTRRMNESQSPARGHDSRGPHLGFATAEGLAVLPLLGRRCTDHD